MKKHKTKLNSLICNIEATDIIFEKQTMYQFNAPCNNNDVFYILEIFF